MKLTFTKEELQVKLSNIQNIVDKRNTMPIISHFLLEAGRKESSITATDLQTALKEPINIQVEKEGKICIPARKMFEIAREIDADMTCESVDEQWLKIKSGASSFRLACLPAKEFPAWPAMDNTEEIAISAESLAEMIARTVYATGESDTRYTLNGLLFHLKMDSSLTLVGTDGHRLALAKSTLEEIFQEEKKLIIPNKAANELKKLLEKNDKKIKMTLSKNHIMFNIGEMLFLTRLVEGTYPNYEQVIPSSNDKKILLPRESFLRALRRVSIMSKERSNAVKMEISENMLSIASSNPDIGDAQDEIVINYSGETVAFGFNARFFIDIIESISSENIVMELQTSLSPVIIREESGMNYMGVVMPIRI